MLTLRARSGKLVALLHFGVFQSFSEYRNSYHSFSGGRDWSLSKEVLRPWIPLKSLLYDGNVCTSQPDVSREQRRLCSGLLTLFTRLLEIINF
jgi:hypothetical protein